MLTARFRLHPAICPRGCRSLDLPLGRTGGHIGNLFCVLFSGVAFWDIFFTCVSLLVFVSPDSIHLVVCVLTCWVNILHTFCVVVLACSIHVLNIGFLFVTMA